MYFYKRALELKNETIENRRYIHKNAETGLDIPKTKAFVMEKLKEYGLEPKDCGYGVTAVLGKKEGKVLLLRADMDALPMAEQSGEEFACPTGKEAHTCGHDFHAAMLLTAAKMLKENEDMLEGTVKFMFQPAEETFEGSKNMIENGILENPKVDAALAYHVSPGKMPVGLFMYNSKDTMMYSVDGFKITIKGKGSHGAYPHVGVDPINIGVHVHLALQELIARESDPSKACVLTIGQFKAGTAANIIPEEAVLQGTIRTNDNEAREKLVRRMKEVAQKTAEVYNGTAQIEMISEVPPLICDSEMTEEIVGFMQETGIPGLTPYPDVSASASEDFAVIAQKVPSTFMYLSAGYMDERGEYPAHHPKVRFNEDVCPVGAACLAHCAVSWLAKHK
ncbi:amidohydrolase [Eubacterium sp. MSJ-13]|uniref:M20 family metallopeptidase n=1 Tax=Eubacterium sp. MSJ-13 TaxID=2841513 RepID=UPI001C0FBAE9|nr:M20 family metallopeptidase [Eubacterium sp. MSJ-13]MBU5479321.1 amidohydrolase [Eubacterium sp. MSJ-13]